ncbi:MAG: ATP-binding cassette domain-containing protein [Agathobacter sp.]|nr:ATP-binding cassette domain-containing protein [Agathobacter sp.]
MKIDGINVYYGKNHILKDFSLEIEKGKIYGIIGKNGAGKTTLLKTISGMIIPKSGKMVGVLENKIGTLIEEPGLFLDMTAFENMNMQCMIVKGKKDEIDKILGMVGLAHVRDTKVKKFSLGMRQRLGLALTLIGNPDILIWDEPINGLDPEGILQIRQLIYELKDKYGKTLIISSHILDELEKVCDEFLFINNGVLVNSISQQELSLKKEKNIIINFENDGNIENVLKEMDIKRYKVSDKTVCIYDDVQVSGLIKKLTNRGIDICEVYKDRSTCESIFIEMIS